MNTPDTEWEVKLRADFDSWYKFEPEMNPYIMRDWFISRLHQELQKARGEERERIKAVIENKRIPLFVALDEDDARRIFKFNEDLDIVLKAIDQSELDQPITNEDNLK